MRRIITLTAMLIVHLLAAHASVGADGPDIDAALADARLQGKTVMLELGSVGCIPCEQMKPVMQKLRDNYAGKLEVIFIDVRRNRPAGLRFGVYAIPTQVFLDKNGKEFHRHSGFYSYEEIVPVLKRAGL